MVRIKKKNKKTYNKVSEDKKYYIYETKEKKIRLAKSRFKSKKQFQHYIESDNYKFNTNPNERHKRIIYQNEIAIETQKPIKRPYITEFRILGKYKRYSASSSSLKAPITKEKDDAGKEQVLYNLSAQIVGNEYYNAPSPPNDEEAQERIESEVGRIDISEIEFSYLFYRNR